MNAREFQDLLRDLFDEVRFGADTDADHNHLARRIFSIRTITPLPDHRAGGSSDGLIVRCDDGSELQVNIVRRR